MNNEKVFVLMESDEYDEVGSIVAVFTGPEAEERAEEVKRLKSMFRESTGDPDVRFHTRKCISNPSNGQLGLAPALGDTQTDPFVQAAVASLFSSGSAVAPAWLNVEWLRSEVHAMTNEQIAVDGQVLRLVDVPTSVRCYDPRPGDAGFVETDQY